MIEGNVELLTAKDAVNAGLLDAVKEGTAKVEGRYTVTADGQIKFKQTTFTFTDKMGNWTFGKFLNDAELLKFGGYALADDVAVNV